MKYVIDIEDKPVNGLYKAKNFNTLVFDKEGLNRLEPLSDCIPDCIPISDAKPGDYIEVCGIDMDVLDIHYPSSDKIGIVHLSKNGTYHSVTNDKYGVLCSSRQIINTQYFDSDCNDWRVSNLRSYLNTNYKNELDSTFIDSLLPFDRSLTSGDGLRYYEDCAEQISILSVEEYRLYRQYIFSNPTISWWLLTSFSINDKYKEWMQIVDPDGVVSYGFVTNKYGVKPLFLLRPSTKVKIIR